MILVITGNDIHSFNRLITFIDKLSEHGKIGECLVQRGYSKYEPRYCNYLDFIPLEKINEYIKKADTVVIHGGFGSFLACVRNEKFPVVVPRLAELNEHEDISQRELAIFLSEQGFCKSLFDLDEESFLQAIEDAKNHTLFFDDIRKTNIFQVINNFILEQESLINDRAE